MLWFISRDNKIVNVYELPILQLYSQAISEFYCLNHYCGEVPSEENVTISNNICSRFFTNGNSGFGAYIGEDETTSLIISNIGPNFMNVYAALPLLGDESSRYYVLNPTRNLNNYIQALAIRAMDQNFTIVSITPTSDVRIYHPISRSFTTVRATETVVLQLEFAEIIWVEVEVSDCNSDATLTGTLIETSNENTAIVSSQALCNATESNSTSLPFSFVMNPLRQFPPVTRWGTVFIFDAYKLSLFSMDNTTVMFHILSSNESSVSITIIRKGRYVCNSTENLGEGEIWSYELNTFSAEAIVINGSSPTLVLYEAYSSDIQYSELLQPIEWFTSRQAIPISYSFRPQPQQFLVSLVITSAEIEDELINIWDDKDHETPQRLDDYEFIDSYFTTRLACYTLVHIAMNSTAYNETNYVLQFELNVTDESTFLGASVFSYNGYAFSNGYNLGKFP